MEQPKKKNKEPKIETPTVEIAPVVEKTICFKQEVIDLMTLFAAIEKGHREVDLAVEESLKLLDQVKSLASFTEKALANKKK